MTKCISNTNPPGVGDRASVGHNSAYTAQMIETAKLLLNPATARLVTAGQIKAAKRILRRFGVRVPLVVDGDHMVIVGEIVLRAAQAMGIEALPVIYVEGLSAVELEALSVAYTRLGELGSWEEEKLGQLCLRFEMEIPDFELEDLGFDVPVIDLAIDAASDEEVEPVPEPEVGPAISVVGDLWLLGKHRILCADATQPSSFVRLMAGAAAHAVFTDPPFGCAINGFVAGEGRHREFVMGSGEMSQGELAEFFTQFNKAIAQHVKPGAVIYEVIDWRSLHLLLDAAKPIFGPLLNLAIWVKDRAGMGSFLRSRHELVLIFKAPGGRYRNNVELGKHGRHRSNVWEYPSAKTASKGSDEGNILASHPTPKPVRLVADALLDTTKRGDIVLDPFLGSGTTLIAAEKVGRICYALDLDPLYVDLAVRRWQAWTGDNAVHADTGETFDDYALRRAKEAAAEEVRS